MEPVDKETQNRGPECCASPGPGVPSRFPSNIPAEDLEEFARTLNQMVEAGRGLLPPSVNTAPASGE
jgi:hypothetical protein